MVGRRDVAVGDVIDGGSDSSTRSGSSSDLLRAEFDRLCASAAYSLQREDAAAAAVAAASAVRLARRLGDPALEGVARLIYGRSLGFTGRLRAGMGQIDRAQGLLDGPARGRALLQRSALLYKMGDPGAALDASRRALELLPPGDADRARALNNLGVVLLYLGQSEQAKLSLAEAERLHRQAARPAQAAESRANQAMALARLGDLVGALRAFDEAERELRTYGLIEGQIAAARAEVLLDAGLLRDVQRELPDVVAALDATGMRVDAAEGLLYLALGLVGLRDPAAVDAARGSRRRFHQAGAPGWEAMASLVEMRARWVGNDISEGALADARRTVAALRRRRLHPYELEAELVCGQLAEALGREGDARRRFERVASERGRGTVRQRAMGWEALARLRVLLGNRPGALRAADAGLRVIERHRDAIGAADLRAGASSQGVELAALALRLAVAGSDPLTVLRWAERWRAGALYRRPIVPPADPVVAELLAELRQTAQAVRTQAAEGRPVGELERRMARFERALADRVRHTAVASDPDGRPGSPGALGVQELRSSLGHRALIEYVECSGELLAVVLDERRCVLRRLGGADDVARSVSAACFALRKLARLRPDSPAVPRALEGFAARLRALRASLLGPLQGLVDDRELVIVPTGRLHAAPWQLLVGAGQVVAVAPSAALWQRASSRPGTSGDVVGVAGPGLPGALREIDAVGRHHDRFVGLTGAEATVAAANEAIDGARLVHLAAHGDVRGDNPLFSSFRLADGPQTVYDLQCLSEAPQVVVLSACNSGLSEVDAGDELLGLVASLLAIGTRTAIAAVLPISDLATVPLMDGLHRRMASGNRPGVALARAASEMHPEDPAAIAATAAFVCLGAA
jgi:tetratricopeptide (TPR) repeat protein